MGFKLPKYKDLAPKASKPVKAFLHDSVGGYERRRPVSVLHASDVTNDKREFCPREHSLLLETGKRPSRQYVNTSMRYTFDMGNGLEATAQEYMASIAVGDWRCLACDHTVIWKRKPTKCPKCKSKRLRYLGARFVSEYSGVSCGIDFIGLFPNEKLLRAVEIKTMVGHEFKTLKAPLAEHTLRTKLYLRCIAESADTRKDEINLDEASILYMCKGYGYKDPELLEMQTYDSFSPFKEFKTSRDDEMVALPSDAGRAYDRFRKGLSPIPYGVCMGPMDKRAKSCPVAKQCFGPDYPGGEYMRNTDDD